MGVLYLLLLTVWISICVCEQKVAKKGVFTALNTRIPGVATNDDARGISSMELPVGSGRSGLQFSVPKADVGNAAWRVVSEMVDEALDCFDAVVFAETGEERLQNVMEIGYRHRAIIATAFAFPVAKNALGKQLMQKRGLDFINHERAKQVSKWGTNLR